MSSGYLSLVCAVGFAEKFNETLQSVADAHRSERQLNFYGEFKAAYFNTNFSSVKMGLAAANAVNLLRGCS